MRIQVVIEFDDRKATMRDVKNWAKLSVKNTIAFTGMKIQVLDVYEVKDKK